MSDIADTKTFLEFSESTVRKAGEVLLAHRNNFQIKKTKDSVSMDIATTADYAAEEIIIKEIKSRFPDHGILTEETSGYESESDFRWIIDPLDGTKEYVRNSPYFYTLLALEHQGKLVCGTGYQPVIPRMFSAAIGGGVKVDGHAVTVSPETSLNRSFVSVALPVKEMPEDKCAKYFSFLQLLRHRLYRLRNNPWDVESLFNVASGVVEAYVTPSISGPKWWDIASGLAAVEASGGLITNFHGNKIENRDISKGILACNNRFIQSAILGLLNDTYLT